VSAARDEILARIGSALADVPRKEDPDARAAGDYLTASELTPQEVVERFAARVADYRARVRRTTPEGIPATVAEAFAAHGASRVAVPADLPAEWRPGGVDWVIDDGALAATELDRLDGALTGCALAIAETGTFVLDGGPTQGRRALTLVPDLHVCVVEAERIVGTVPEAIRALEPGARAHRRPLTFVSGPSATSDIELKRVEGVHGPRRLELVIAG
jgi:L-lactate dehydrogenase complex protein LldG